MLMVLIRLLFPLVLAALVASPVQPATASGAPGAGTAAALAAELSTLGAPTAGVSSREVAASPAAAPLRLSKSILAQPPASGAAQLVAAPMPHPCGPATGACTAMAPEPPAALAGDIGAGVPRRTSQRVLGRSPSLIPPPPRSRA